MSSFIKATAKEVSYLLRDFSNAIMYFSKISSVPVLRSFSNYHRNFSVFSLPHSNLNQISSNLIVLALTVIFCYNFQIFFYLLLFFLIKFFDDDSILLDSDFYVTRLFDWIIFIQIFGRVTNLVKLLNR